MTKSILICLVMLTLAVGLSWAQEQPPAAKQGAKKAPLSPPAETSVTINGKTITIKYSAPSMRGRPTVFGEGGPIRKDATYPVWRAGANFATTIHTDADLQIKTLTVPAGDYTLYVQVQPEPWTLIVNKQLKDPNRDRAVWGLTYIKDQDLGRVPMDMSKPSAPIETLKWTLTATKGNVGKIQLEWESFIASVPFTVK